MANNLFIDSSLKRYVGFYQQLFRNISDIHELGSRLIFQAEQAQAFREVNKVEELGLILSNFPNQEFKLIGQYYLGWCAYRKGESARGKFEKVIELSGTYRTRALWSLAAVEASIGNYDRELSLLCESVKYTENPAILIELFKGIAVVKAKEGYHRQALEDLERLIPMLSFAKPHVYFDILNSYAVELGEVGRIEEAKNICNIVVASPYAFSYPEWHETAEELKEPRRSFVVVPSIQQKPSETETIETHYSNKLEQPARVVSFPPLKEAPQPQKPDRLTPQEYAGLTASDKRELILAALKSGAIREDDYFKMMVMVGLLKNGPSDKVLDLEDETVLDDIIVIWSHQIDPEELAAVLSALRDCDDRMRQRNILDRMIRIAFEETQLCGITEEEWRLRVERRLPKT